MERSVEIFAIILIGVVGLSHLLQPKAWVEYFILLRSKGEAGAFVDGFVHLPLAGFHHRLSQRMVWDTGGASAVGWAFLIKSLIRFCIPKLGLRMMARVSFERYGEVRGASALLLVLAGLLSYGVYAG